MAFSAANNTLGCAGRRPIDGGARTRQSNCNPWCLATFASLAVAAVCGKPRQRDASAIVRRGACFAVAARALWRWRAPTDGASLSRANSWGQSSRTPRRKHGTHSDNRLRQLACVRWARLRSSLGKRAAVSSGRADTTPSKTYLRARERGRCKSSLGCLHKRMFPHQLSCACQGQSAAKR